MATRLRKLRLGEVSLVDRGANQHSHVLLWKRDAEPVAKGPGADALTAALGVGEAMEQVGAFREAVWEVLDALGSAVCRLQDDVTVTDKAAAIKEAVDAALAALPAQVAEETAEGDDGGDGAAEGDVGKAAAAADGEPPKADGRAGMGPAKRKLNQHLNTLREKLKGAKHAGHVAAALGHFARGAFFALPQMPAGPAGPGTDTTAADAQAQPAAKAAAAATAPPPHLAGDGAGKGAASPATLSTPAAGDGATARTGMTEQVKAGGADTGAVDQTELRKRLDEQAAELAELKKKAGEVDELRKRADEAETIAKAERELRLEAEFTKRAEDELPALAGPPLVKGRMLRRIVERTLSADEAVKKQAEAELTVLKAANEAATATYRPIGKAGRPENGGSPAAELDERAEALAKEKAITKRDAMVAIVRSDADLAARLKSEVH